jgi:hypothetical protein
MLSLSQGKANVQKISPLVKNWGKIVKKQFKIGQKRVKIGQ